MILHDWRFWDGIITGVTFAILLWLRDRRNQRAAGERRFTPIIPPIALLGACLGVFALSLITRWFTAAASVYESVSTLVQAGAYYVLLLLLHPLLRRFVSGQGRAVLWVLPNARYTFIRFYTGQETQDHRGSYRPRGNG